MFIYGGFIFLFVYAYTEQMDNSPYAWIWEIVKSSTGLCIIFLSGDWFGINQLFPYLSLLIAVYLFISTLICFYFQLTEVKQNPSVLIDKGSH
jgi:alkylglycerol monooxygenase